MTPEELQKDKDFMAASPNDQTRYLMQTDPEFAKASSADQAAYLAHVTNQPMQEGEKEGFWGGVKSAASKLNPFGESKPQPVEDINKVAMRNYGERSQKHGIPYAIGAGLAENLGSDVSGSEEAAERGDPGAVVGHLVPGAAIAASPIALEGLGRIATSEPVGRVLSTAGRTAENFDVMKPFKTFGKMSDYWNESSPWNRARAETAQAVREGRAARIPTRLNSNLRDWPTGESGTGTIRMVDPNTGEVINGTMPKGFGRMILTPEEAAQRENLYKISQRSAHERGMHFAGGRVPAEGRKVPFRPLPNTVEEWSGKRPTE